ncbi:MAG: hypothetical protein GX546_03990 [Acholeplasmataceae bacterium]|nr:hypothetical protein [Acholeplasmataceae bacterium]
MDDNARRNFQKLAENQEAQKERAFKNEFYDPSGSEFMKTMKRIRQENIRREELESKHQEKKREEDDFQDTESFFENYEAKLSKITKRKNNAKEIKIIKRRVLVKRLIMIGLPILIVIIIALVLIFTVFK